MKKKGNKYIILFLKRNRIIEIKNLTDGSSCRLDTLKEETGGLEDKPENITQNEMENVKRNGEQSKSV